MSIILALLATLLHIGLCLAGAPLLYGAAAKLRAWMCGQRGASLLQPYRHLAKLLGKTALMPDTATALFTIWPLVAFMAMAVVTMLIPGFCTGMLTASASDYVTIMGLFVFGRAAMLLGGFETGSAFGGAGGARMALLGLGAEATLLVLLLIFSFFTQSTNLDQMAVKLATGHAGLSVAMGFALAAMLVVAVIMAGCRPAGQSELAMRQEAMALEYAGRQLALFDYARMLRHLAWMNLLICLFLPYGMARAVGLWSWPGGLLLWLLKLLCLTIGFALFQSLRAETRLFRMSEVLGVALFIGLLASILLLISVGTGA